MALRPLSQRIYVEEIDRINSQEINYVYKRFNEYIICSVCA